MKKKNRVYPQDYVKASSNKIYASTFWYDVYANDPADWQIDWDAFFEMIRECLNELGINFEEEEGPYSNGYGLQELFHLDNGKTLDSYELETEILYALSDGNIDKNGQHDYIINYINNL